MGSVDFTIFDREDLNTKLQIAQIERLRINQDKNVILIRGFVGGADGRQYTPFNTAMSEVKAHYAKQNIIIKSEMYTNDFVKNIMKWGPTEMIDHILEGDAHVILTHLTEANIGKTASWNVPNILSNFDRLKFHLGNTMGVRNKCPVLRQGKREIYEMLPDYCLPTLIIDLPRESWDPTLDLGTLNSADVAKIRR
jgi:hypothetical protein